jgi:hypothetical protein
VVEDDLFDENNEIAYDTIILGCTPPQQKHIAHCQEDGKTAWEVFERLYDASHAQKPTRLALRRQLYKSSPMNPGESIRDFITRKITISEKLLDLGTLVDESELADCILMDVADEFRGIVGVLERRGGYGLSDVKGALAQEELEKRMRAVSTVEPMEIKRENSAAIALHPPAPPPTIKRPLLGMGADHPPTTVTPIRPANVPIAIARQTSTRSAKRPHQEDRDEDMPTASGGTQTSPTTSEAKKKSGEEKEDFKKPRMGIRNGGRKQKIQARFVLPCLLTNNHYRKLYQRRRYHHRGLCRRSTPTRASIHLPLHLRLLYPNLQQQERMEAPHQPYPLATLVLALRLPVLRKPQSVLQS